MKKGRILTAAVLMVLMTAIAMIAFAGTGLWPAEPGKKVKKDGKLRVDVANIQNGYVQASVKSKSKKRMKLRIKKGKETLTYDLNGDANYEIFPLQLGSGKYTISLYENVKGKSYSSAGSVSVNAKFDDPDICFYYPNQYVSYTQKTAAVSEAEKICANMSKAEAYDAVCGYVKTHFAYDFIKAVTIKAGVLPDIDSSWDKHMGICQDLAAITCCMMRTQGIPARLTIGMADKNYHAWVEVKFDKKEHFFDPTVAVNGLSGVKSYTTERFY